MDSTAFRLRNKTQMELTVGQCLMEWAKVEFQLNSLYLHATKSKDVNRWGAVWGSLKSFDARLEILKSLYDLYGLSIAQRNDFVLLLETVRSYSKKRNAVAHATLLVGQTEATLEPFFTLTTKKPRLQIGDVAKYAEDFGNLAEGLLWFWGQLTPLPPETAKLLPSLTQLPDLVRELREQQSLTRKGHQEQQRDMRLVARLRKAGNWPPPEDTKKSSRRERKVRRKEMIQKLKR